MASQQICTINLRNSLDKFQKYWSTNISEFNYIKKSDDIHDLPQFESISDLNLAFKIRTFALSIPPDHGIYTYKNSVKNIVPTNLIKVLYNYKLCTGVENTIFYSAYSTL